MFSEATSNIRQKLIAMGILLAVAPMITLLAAGWIVMQRISQASLMDVTNGNPGANLTHLTRNLFDICRGYHERIAAKLKSGGAVLDSAGAITLDSDRQLVWQAKNEITGEVTQVTLPVMMAGNAKFVPVADFNQTAPIVDEIERTYGTVATIFQRMNENGDMLSVSSSEKSEGGTRAVGSYIPAVSADGHATRALQTVMAGQTYLGRMFVAKAGYLAAYQPLKDGSGAVVGMLYTAVPEDEIATKVREIAVGGRTSDHEELFVLRAEGDERGTALIMGDKSLEGRNLWDEKDSAGQRYVQEICKRAVTLPPGDVAEYKYRKIARVGGIPRTVIARFAYLPEWDWVVGFAQPEANFLAGASAVRASATWGMWLLLGVGLAGTGLVIRIWIKFSSDLTYKLGSRLAELTKKSREIGAMAGAISEEVQRAGSTLTPSSTTNVLAKVGRTAEEITLAIRHIDASSDSVSGVIGSIEQIAFAANMLAASAAIGASQTAAGDKAIANITAELRQLVQHCGEAARHTKEAIEQSRIELEKGNREVTKLVTDLRPADKFAAQPSEDAGAPLHRQTENLIRLTAAIDQGLERMYTDLGVDRR